MPVPRQVGNEDAVAPRERRRERAPVLDRPAESVHEHDRRPVAPDRVAKPRAVDDELAIGESVETLFALRHH